MGFYIRKALQAGPVRFNLSKSGVGVSVGVKGFRVGSGPSGPYVHAGRGGLYYRQSLSSKSAPKEAAAGPGLPEQGRAIEKLVETQTYPSRALHASRVGAFSEPPRVDSKWLLFPPAYLVKKWLGKKYVERAEKYGAELLALVDTPEFLGPSFGDRVKELKARHGVPEGYGAWAHERLYEGALSSVVSDFEVSPGELDALLRLEDTLAIGPSRASDLKVSWFKAGYMAAIADGKLSVEEEKTLQTALERLGVPFTEVKAEAETIERLKKVRQLLEGEPTPVSASVALDKGEVCYFEAPGRMLVKRIIARFQSEGVQYKNLGLLTRKEGALLITDKRLMLVGQGTTAIELDKIVDLEVDHELNLITVSKKDRKTPLYFSTPDGLAAGAVLQRLVDGLSKED